MPSRARCRAGPDLLVLLATGELCHGAPLHDRQHPHDLFMELSAAYSRALSGALAFEVYAGVAGEPALGPTAYPHRPSAMPSPIAPITHHWLDSTHISFGVVTAGVFGRQWKVEGSVFNGREPDEQRLDLDLGPLDSFAGVVPAQRALGPPGLGRPWAASTRANITSRSRTSKTGEELVIEGAAAGAERWVGKLRVRGPTAVRFRAVRERAAGRDTDARSGSRGHEVTASKAERLERLDAIDLDRADRVGQPAGVDRAEDPRGNNAPAAVAMLVVALIPNRVGVSLPTARPATA